MISYPNGNASSIVTQKAKNYGYIYGFTTERSCVSSKDDNMTIPRIDVSQNQIKGNLDEFSEYLFEWNVR